MIAKFYDRYWKDKEELEDFSYKWPAIKQFIPKDKNIRVLDFGCGKGRILKEILSVNSSLSIIGVDVSKESLKFAKKQFPSHHFCHIQEGKKLPFQSKTFDFIIALDVLEHIYDTQLAFAELARVLKDGGKLLLSVPYHGLIKNLIITIAALDSVFDPRSPHIRFYTKNTLLREVHTAGLKECHFGYFGRFYPVSKGMFCLCEKPKRKT